MHVSSDSIVSRNRSDHLETVTEALASAQAKKSDEVELHLHAGHYDGTITVDKPLTIIGETGNRADIVLNASILNRGGKNLRLRNITINEPKNYGILQIGGTLELQNVLIKGVAIGKTKEVAPFRNACISILGGAILKATGLSLLMNNLVALCVDGENSKAVICDVIVKDNKISSCFIKNPPLMCGAIEVTNKGTLCIEKSTIANNEYRGICVHDSGKMHLRGSTVTGTKQVLDTTGSLQFGDNIFVASGSTVELHSFVSSCAQRVGIFVDQAYLTAENGSVNDNNIGICIFSSPTDDQSYNPYNCIYENVLFVNNATKIGNGDIPLPNSLTPDRSLCKVVPWN
jgi:hypothetical protein